MIPRLHPPKPLDAAFEPYRARIARFTEFTVIACGRPLRPLLPPFVVARDPSRTDPPRLRCPRFPPPPPRAPCSPAMPRAAHPPRSFAAVTALVACCLVATAARSQSRPHAHASWPGALPVATAPERFRHFGSGLRASTSEPWHRAQDVIVRAGQPAWVEARFAYGLGDGRLGDEDVAVYLRRADSVRWIPLGRTRTADEGHAVVRGDGSRSEEDGLVSFRVPGGEQLPPGLHALRFVVCADQTVADATIAVVAQGAQLAVSDVDGTLTESENSFGYSVAGLAHTPTPHAGAAELFSRLADRGYTIVYLTARPDIFAQATRAWLATNGFPHGVVRTREGAHFAFGGPDHAAYKIAALRDIARVVGHPVDIGFGNTATDVRAYEAGGIPAAARFFYRLDGDLRGGVPHDDYRTLAQRIPALAAPTSAPAVTQP
ncbi:MAG: phosphatidylinositol transfer protein [Deltaproteobacteria bacterium]